MAYPNEASTDPPSRNANPKRLFDIKQSFNGFFLDIAPHFSSNDALSQL
jgi:hypothetical protein